MRFGIQLLLFIAIILRTSTTAHAQAGAGQQPPYPQVLDPVKIAAAEAREHAWDQIAKQGMEVLKKGDKPKAIKLLEQYMTRRTDFDVRMTLVGIYAEAGRADDEIRLLRPIIYADESSDSPDYHLATTRMLYVLALLDNGDWAEAATVYEESFAGAQVAVYHQPTLALHTWQLPGYTVIRLNHAVPVHTVPQKHFSVDQPDYTGLQAQAHLILGVRESKYIPPTEVPAYVPTYMLGQLKLALKYDPYSPDAHYVSGILLDSLGRYKEARYELSRAARLAPEEAQPEIKQAFKDLDSDEKRAKDAEAWYPLHPIQEPAAPSAPQ